MKLYSIRTFIICSLLFALFQGLSAQTPAEKKLITIPAEVIVDKIRGGMFGMMIGNMNGWPYEFKFYDKHGDVQTYVPSLPKGAETDDDTDFEWVYIYNMQKTRNAYVPYDDINAYWKKSINRGIWCANRQARYLMDLGIKPPLTGNVVLNPWAEFNVSGQFLCESYGLVAAAMPQTAAKIGLHYTKVAIDNEPAQTTQLFTTMISTAFLESDVNKILDASVAALDPKSLVIQIIADVRKWHAENPNNPAETHRLMHEKYAFKDDDPYRNKNGFNMNTAAIIAAFLYGNGNFAETIRHSMNFGYDADCNCATLGTLLGTMYGHRRMMNEGWTIVDRYKNTKRDNMPMDETISSFADRIIDLFEMVNQENGGTKTVENNVVVYKIQSEKPSSVYPLLTYADELAILKTKLQSEIVTSLLSGDKQAKARAAYYAVALDINKEMQKKYPKQWKEACYDLSGYWKIMSITVSGNYLKSHIKFQEKFRAAGFIPLAIKLEKNAIQNDMKTWKDPKILYTKSDKK